MMFFVHLGWVGVDLFFVLSGYLITGILSASRNSPHYFRNFLIRRALRILPLYYLCIGLFCAAAYFHPDKSSWKAFLDWGGPFWFIFYLGNFRIVMENAAPPIFAFFPLWSLQVEEQFYLLYPFVVAVCPTPILKNVLWGCAAFALGFRCFATLFFPGTSAYICYVLTPSRMDALAIGGLVSIYLKEPGSLPSLEKIRKITILLAALCFTLFILVSPQAFHPWIQTVGYTLVDVTCAAVLILIVMSPAGILSSFLKSPLLVITGQIAYGLYILHAPVGWALSQFLERYAGMNSRGPMASLIIAAAVFTVAWISWHFFESRIVQLKKKWA